jgi:hypothetical protein
MTSRMRPREEQALMVLGADLVGFANSLAVSGIKRGRTELDEVRVPGVLVTCVEAPAHPPIAGFALALKPNADTLLQVARIESCRWLQD